MTAETAIAASGLPPAARGRGRPGIDRLGGARGVGFGTMEMMRPIGVVVWMAGARYSPRAWGEGRDSPFQFFQFHRRRPSV